MLDVAIVGGGLCGLALAHSLQARGRDWRLFEARARLGGRALTARAEDGTPVDLGPTWFWPQSQPTIARLVADLGLPTVEQLDDGRVLHLHDPQRTPQAVALTEQMVPAASPDVPARPGAVHGGAHRVAGGIGQVIEAIARPLPADRLRTQHHLEAVIDHGDFVELRLRHGAALLSVHARQAVLAMPPRVVAANVRFTPALPVEVQAAMDATPTWMATAAKAGFTYRHAFWHDAGHTGNAWVHHPQAMLAEVFDASTAQHAALAGFAALGASQREQFQRGRELLLDSQVVQLFGPSAANDTLRTGCFWHDWAQESETCSPRDIAEEGLQAGEHPLYGEPALGEPHWDGRLYFGGSETARQGGGYMEGALGAAGRLRRQLLAGSAATLRPAEAANEAANEAGVEAANEAQLQQFEAWVGAERSDALARYRERLHQALSHQEADQLTQRAVLTALESLYDAALQRLEQLPLSTGHLAVERGRAALTPRVLAPFNGLADELLAQAVVFNATSCALSNFPAEHHPSGEYLRTIRRDLAAAWQSFAVAANQRLLAKATFTTAR
jgi:monoamine oxidase